MAGVHGEGKLRERRERERQTERDGVSRAHPYDLKTSH
jgi:hypothetical protein